MKNTSRRAFLAGCGLGLLAPTASASTIRSEGGLLETTLEARAGSRYYNYNGLMPGPRWELSPGDTLRVQFRNLLSEHSNLHFHGLHVSPQGNGDNPFLMVPPGEQFDYEIAIPADHPGGTFWYHPHIHGSTARQVFLGLSGLIVVRGAMDEIPEIAAAREEFLVLKDFDPNGDPAFSPAARMTGREGSLLTVNGEINPVFQIGKGELARWRVLNASASRYYRLKLDDHELGVIALDGGPLADIDWRPEWLLTPGQRVEFLIRGERPNGGTYRLWNLPYDRGAAMGMGFGGATQAAAVLARLTYEGDAGGLAPLPSYLPRTEALPRGGVTRTFRLGSGMGMDFTINGRGFDENRIDTRVQQEAVEDWEIQNPTTMDHPFHVHVNPFQLVSSDGSAQPVWRDVVNVRRGTSVRIRTRFADYRGRTVYHCHILDHEDAGMMGTLEIG